ncbi:hypothetical protein NQ318_015336 [Aromia moschata]|uniref:Uncharacterized protein n=1 Tax=Aromia moschata TaxID=1265417 RepID=A0AAV8X9E8_9CUCU|nr:hypothetical protein NQ318_015336 [Aromia moschata]
MFFREIRGQYYGLGSLLCDKGTDLFPENLTFTDDFFEVIDQLNIRPLIQCKFIGDEYRCSAVFTPIILDEGVCYTFNMMNRDEIFKENVVHFSNYHKNENKSEWHIDRGYSKDSTLNAYPLRALLSGADNSIQVTFMHFQSDTDYICVEDVLGYSVLLHSPDTIPQLKKQYFQVPFDTVVIAAVQPIMMTTSEQVKKYDPFDRECYFADERWLKFFKIYTPGNCRLECITNYTLKQCGCVNFYMPRDNSTVICGNGNWNCMKNAERKLKLIQLKNHLSYTDEEEDDIDLADYCDCMPLCTELSYSIEQSQTEWKWNEQLVADRMVEDNKLQKEVFHFSKLSVFFKLDQFLTSQRNELYGPTDFLANFGGLLGLFTGFSLLSLMEIIYFLTLRIFCNRRQYRVWAGNVDKN